MLITSGIRMTTSEIYATYHNLLSCSVTNKTLTDTYIER